MALQWGGGCSTPNRTWIERSGLLIRMIVHRLIALFLKKGGGSPEFYRLQALDAIKWMARCGVVFGPDVSVLDLGCGFGDIGGELAERGCRVTMADDESFRLPQYRHLPFRQINLDRDDIASLGRYDLVILSNVLEHLAKPERVLNAIQHLLNGGGRFYLSWTNWLSPWGGHEFSPYHYLGPRLGCRVYDRLIGKPRQHILYESLFPTYIGSVLRTIRGNSQVRIARMIPRYYPELAFLVRLPVIREFLTWNCAMLIEGNNRS
jgi:SAM-dependent methyltransferase